MASLYCPFCSTESISGFADCVACGAFYNRETLSFGESAKKIRETGPGDRRRYLGAQKRIKVAYASPKAFVKSYIFDQGLGGVFIETDDPKNEGERVDLSVFLPDKGEAMDVYGEVAWNRKKTEKTPEGNLPAGMGIKFLDLSRGDIERIITVLHRTL